MRPPEEIKAEIEDKLSIFKAGALIRFDVKPDIYLACDMFGVVKVTPIYAEDKSEEAVHWFLGYSPAFHPESQYGAARVVKVLSWNWIEDYEVELELDGSNLGGAKFMHIELLSPDNSVNDRRLMQYLEAWRRDKMAFEHYRRPEVVKKEYELGYKMIHADCS